MSWVQPGKTQYISYARGSKACILNSSTDAVALSKDYSQLFDGQGKSGSIVGLHKIEPSIDSLKSVKHLVVNSSGFAFVDVLGSKKAAKNEAVFRLKGDNVVKSTQSHYCASQLAVCSKDTTLQLWDVNSERRELKWQAKNLPNDELDLKIPVYDTGAVFCSERVIAVSNGYGNVRHYDVRASRKAISNVTITKKDMMLTHILQSKVNENHLYVVTQEGNPIMLDRRFNCRVIRKMPGAKGTARDAQLLSQDTNELLLTVGCDRHLRVFDPS
jgi:WD40 repeat protein